MWLYLENITRYKVAMEHITNLYVIYITKSVPMTFNDLL